MIQDEKRIPNDGNCEFEKPQLTIIDVEPTQITPNQQKTLKKDTTGQIDNLPRKKAKINMLNKVDDSMHSDNQDKNGNLSDEREKFVPGESHPDLTIQQEKDGQVPELIIQQEADGQIDDPIQPDEEIDNHTSSEGDGGGITIDNNNELPMEPVIEKSDDSEQVGDDIDQNAGEDDEYVSETGETVILMDERGIYNEKNGETIYVSNITRIEYLYTLIIGNDHKNRIRVLKINDKETEIQPDCLTSKAKFGKLLIGQSNTIFNGDQQVFQNLVNYILSLDNGLIVEDLKGFGKVHPAIYHFGNEIIINGEKKPYQEIIWSEKTGVRLEKSGKLSIDPDSYSIEDIWNKINVTYSEYSFLMTGFAIATLFFDDIIGRFGGFPILYISGESGTGKSKMAEIISNLLACDSELFTVNCDSLSTHVGVDEKIQSLNNLPLILNEVNHKWYAILKSRYDGEGAIKASSSKISTTTQRQVKGSTIVTSVFRPQDSQVVSRSIFLSTENIERDFEKFSDLYHNRRKLSGFIMSVIMNLKIKAIMSGIDEFRKSFQSEPMEPRIISNYAIIAGALTAFINHFDIKGCDQKSLMTFFKREMEEAEKGLNPVYHLMLKLRALISKKREINFMTWDEKYVYIHIEGLWQYLPQSFRDQYYRKLKAKDIKNMFANSTCIARFGDTFPESNDSLRHSPVKSFNKKIKGDSKKCVVLLRDSI